MHLFLEPDRLVLRRYTAADVDHFVEHDGDPAVVRFLTGGTPRPAPSTATVTGDPVSAVGYTWFQIVDAAGTSGWVAGDYLSAA